MAPLIILTVVTLLLYGAGAAGIRWLRPWPVALRGGLAAMFAATGIAHFVGMRAELIKMVPPGLPAPDLLVTVTGVLELMGAVGLLWTRTSPWAAAGLSAMLVAMFPANIYAALEGLSPDVADRLLPRSAMQVVFLAATLAVLIYHLRIRRASNTHLSGIPELSQCRNLRTTICPARTRRIHPGTRRTPRLAREYCKWSRPIRA